MEKTKKSPDKTKLRVLDSSVNSFEAGGHKYLVHGSLGLGRFIHFEQLQAQLGHGLEFDKQFEGLKKAWEFLNSGKPAEAAVQIHNMMHGVLRGIESREHPALLLCTLFIVREGDDLTRWDATEAKERIDDWKNEGFEIESFFRFAFSLVRGLDSALVELSQDTLPGAGEQRKPKKKQNQAQKSA